MAMRLWSGIKLILLIAGLALIALSDFASRAARPRVLPTQAELESVLPGANLKDRKLKPIPHYPGKIQVRGQTRRAVALLTAELPPKIKGFTDQINILFAIDETGNILGLKVISQRETPYYFRLIRSSGFFEKLAGRRFDQLRDIKAVSGASISSNAALKDLQASANLAMREIFKQQIQEAPSASLLRIYFQPRMIALMLVLLLGLSVRYLKIRQMRWLVFGLSVIVIGFWLKTPFSLPHIFQIASLQAPFESNPYLIILGGFVILSTIFFGPLWCAYLCPYAGLQELAGEIGKKRRWRPSAKTMKIARELRWLIVFAALVLYFPLRIRAGSEIEPFFHLFSKSWTGAGLLLAAFTLFASAFVPRFWCRFFCPTGAILILLSSHKQFFRRVQQGLNASKIDSDSEG